MAEICGIVVGLLGPAVELGKCIVAPIKRQLVYLCCFSSNMKNLRDEATNLENARDELQMRVTKAQNNAEMIVRRVETWLGRANESIQVTMNGIEGEIAHLPSGCLALKSRFLLSKKAVKTTEAMERLREECCSFDAISHPALPAAMGPIPLGPTMEFESRKLIEEKIMTALKDEKVNMIGICGMGGVGKTTMAIKVTNKVREEKLFDEAVMAVVSQQVDKLKIQGDMAENLGVNLEEKGNLLSRAHKLHTRLTGGKRILIVLDDVWEYLKLEELIGITPESGLQGCKILLTSRVMDVLTQMSAEPVCQIQTLSEEDSWSLFKDKVGTCVNDPNVLPVAQEIEKECKGLPIALVNVALALKDKNDKRIWKDALEQLKSFNPEDMPKVLEDVYKPLKLSYDFLGNQHAKSIFLFCCLFPEDRNISLEYLTAYAMGLCMFGRIREVEQVRNRTYTLVQMLKSRFLLLDSWNQNYVRMHDVVRDVAIFIASKEKRIKCGDCTWISPFLGERIELPLGSKFPNLSLLSITEKATGQEEIKINDNSFEGMAKLNVLSMRSESLSSLPHTTQLLTNLRSLILYECWSLESISVVGELVSLEIFICRGCYPIKELPLGIRKLDRLKLLEISDCWALKTIAQGIISSLTGLEELKLLQSFKKWEAEDNGGKERKNAALNELASLSNMTSLGIEILDSALAAEQIRLPPKMARYDITIGRPGYGVSSYSYEKIMRLHLPIREITLGKWIHQCVRSVECMLLEGEGSNNLDLGQAQNMRSLTFAGCSTVKKLVNITSIPAKDCILQLEVLKIVDCEMMEQIFLWKEEENENVIGRELRHTTIFPRLKQLRLSRLPNLTTFCQGIESIKFPLLTEMRIKHCPKLKSFVLSTTSSSSTNTRNNSGGSSRDDHEHEDDDSFHLVCTPEKLEVLEIVDCGMMEHVFLWKEEENEKGMGRESHHVTTFQKLKRLKLSKLPRLTTICEGFESIEFPLLTEMQIRDCSNLRSHVLSTTSSSTNEHNNSGAINNGHDDSLHLFCTPEKVAFGSLKELMIGEYNNLSILWCDKITNDFFTGLEELWLYHCDGIKSLFSSSIARNLVNLKQLRIYDCGEMVKVIEDYKEKDACEISTVRLFPNLKELYLCDLPKLKRLREWRCALELRSLEKVKIKGLKMERFNFGSALTTPNLKEIEINNVDIINTNEFIDVLQIRRLRIESCQVMEQVVSLLNEKENEKDIGQSRRGCNIALPEMENLELCDLPNLTTFSKGMESIEFPMLRAMKIDNCRNLNHLVSTTCSSSGCTDIGDNDNDSLHLFCEPKVAFGRLKGLEISKYGSNVLRLWCHKIPNGFFNGLEWLHISNCGNIRNLFSSSIVGNFVNLEELRIHNCAEMVTVIDNDKENDACGGQSTISLFPRLTYLLLLSLSKLENFCEWRSCALVLPSLQYVEFSDCSKIERFSLGSAPRTPKLITIKIDEEDVINNEDLNVALQQHFVRVTEEKEKNKKTEEKEREEKEDREQDQKRRGEIEEEEI